jgi:hypothetical protein
MFPLRVVCVSAVLLASAGAGALADSKPKVRPSCDRFTLLYLYYASTVLVGDVLSVTRGKAGASIVEVRPREFLRGGPADRLRFVDRGARTGCPPASVTPGETYFMVLFEDPVLGLVDTLRPWEPGAFVGPALLPFRGGAVDGLAAAPVPLASVRAAVTTHAPRARYEPAFPAASDAITAAVPGSMRCDFLTTVRRAGKKLFTMRRRGSACGDDDYMAAYGPVELPVTIGRLPPGHYVHFIERDHGVYEWIGSFDVVP